MSRQTGESPAQTWSVESTRSGSLGRMARALLALTKPLQTSLLLITGVCAYALTLPGAVRWAELALGGIALSGAISGCTVLNMVLDRDIDAQMPRTAGRPIPAQLVSVRGAILYGLGLSIPGLILAWWLDSLFGFVVTLGFAFDLGVYTLWLKRRTSLSILWGGLSGGMPALAGRALALGRIDIVGILLASGVLLWIPAHTLTLAVRYANEYEKSDVPVWPNVYGPGATMRLVAVATLGGATVLGTAGYLIGIHMLALGVLTTMGIGLSALALAVLIKPSEQLNWVLFKAASLYMLGAFLCLTIGTIL